MKRAIMGKLQMIDDREIGVETTEARLARVERYLYGLGMWLLMLTMFVVGMVGVLVLMVVMS